MRPPKHSDLHPNLVNGFRDTTTSQYIAFPDKIHQSDMDSSQRTKNITSSNLRVFPNTDPRLKNSPIITTGRAKTPKKIRQGKIASIALIREHIPEYIDQHVLRKKTSTKPSTTSGHRSDISKSKIAPFTIRLSLDDIRALGINTPLYDSILERDSKNLQQIKVLHQQKEEEVEDAMSSGAGILVKEFSVSISKKDMHTLSGSSWLNDEIINFYGQLCMKRANEAPDLYPKIHVFNTFFYEKLRTQGYSSIRRWTKKVDLFSKDLVIIPIHIGMHWTCAAINFKNSQFEYYDSLLGDNFSCLELLRDYLIQEHADKKEPIDLDDWSDYIPRIFLPAEWLRLWCVYLHIYGVLG
ncbi:sentrin-specific protease [Batrachochytrium salamandrivorans]|nr:sentrin-specific protease [Batrachochytrium salamandrivorans]